MILNQKPCYFKKLYNNVKRQGGRRQRQRQRPLVL